MIDEGKHYPAVRETGVDWLGEVPEHWDVLRGRHLFEIKKRIAGELGHPVISITQSGLRVKDVETGLGQVSQDYSKYQIVKSGDFAMNSMDLLTGGVGIATADGVTSPDYRVFTIRDHSRCLDRYMLHVFRTLYKNRGFYSWGQGSAQLGRWRLPRKRFNDFPFPVPPLSEQTFITRCLDRVDLRVRKSVHLKRKLLELLIEQRNNATQEAVQSHGTQVSRLEVVADSIKRPVTRRSNVSYTPIGLFNRGRGTFRKESRPGDELGDSDFYWVEKGDLVISGQFAWEGAIALAGESEDGCVVSHRYPILRGNPGVLDSAFLLAYFQTDWGNLLLNHHSRGAAGRNRPLNARSLMKEKIPIPPFDVQLRISEMVQRELAMRRQVEMSIGLLNEYSTRLTADLVAGKLDVREEAAALPEVDPLYADADLVELHDSSEVADLEESDAAYEEA